jgi:hypothetical protein
MLENMNIPQPLPIQGDSAERIAQIPFHLRRANSELLPGQRIETLGDDCQQRRITKTLDQYIPDDPCAQKASVELISLQDLFHGLEYACVGKRRIFELPVRFRRN